MVNYHKLESHPYEGGEDSARNDHDDSTFADETSVFNSGFHPDTEGRPAFFGPPSEQSDTVWRDMIEPVLWLQIPTSQARILPDRTSAIPGHPELSVTALDVYHQLHCFDIIQHRLSDPDATMPYGDPKHTWHCIDSIRQGLMCNADLSTIPFRWKPEVRHIVPWVNTTHTCKSWQVIADWAYEHRLTVHFNQSVPPED